MVQTLGTFAVGTNAERLAFDGSNIWISNRGSNTVTELRAKTGAVVGTFPVGTAPIGVAFDGANIWVANNLVNPVSKL
jgi:YVTN family beta-propeller protein